MRYCDHQFHVIKMIDGDKPAIIACAFCGHLRYITADGTVGHKNEEGKVIKYHNGNNGPTQNQNGS